MIAAINLWPRLQNRAVPSKTMQFCAPLLALGLTLLVGGLLFFWLGKDPFVALRVFLIDPLRDHRAIGEILLKMIPLGLCALGLTLCYRANIWNIGAEGQLVIGALCAGAVVLRMEPYQWPAFVVIGGALLAGALGGMLWAAITAFCKEKWHANEILVSLMLTYIAQLLLGFMVSSAMWFKDPAGFNFPQSKVFDSAYTLSPLISGTRVHWGLLVMLGLALLFTIFLFRTAAGYALRVTGSAPQAARYGGFSPYHASFALLICGACAGLAGAFEVMGPIGQLLPTVSPGYGFAAIIVAFIARLHPIGVIFGSFIMALLYLGGELAQSRLGLPPAITGIFQGLLLFFLLACDTLITRRLYFTPRRKT